MGINIVLLTQSVKIAVPNYFIRKMFNAMC